MNCIPSECNRKDISLYVKLYHFLYSLLGGLLACTRKLMGSFVEMHAPTNYICRHRKQHRRLGCLSFNQAIKKMKI